MQAIVIRRFGDASVLEAADVSRPTCGARDLLVRVDAAGVNPLDWKIRRGNFRWMSGARFPMVPGTDAAGVVEEVGTGVRGFTVGQRVFGASTPRRQGAYAEYAALPAAICAPIPEGLSAAEAAALPGSGCSALQALRDLGQLEAGHSVLIIGASGGVGTFAVQIARAWGAEVTGVCSGRNAELVRSLGAARVIDYKTEEVWDRPGGYDVVLDAVAAHEFADARRVLKRHGTYITTLPSGRRILAALWSRIRPGPRARLLLVRPRAADLERLADLTTRGEIRPVIERRFPLHEARVAHQLSESGRVRGKLVLEIGSA